MRQSLVADACSSAISPRDSGSAIRRALGASATVLAGSAVYVVLGFLSNVLLINALSPADFGLLTVALGVLVVLQEICGGGLDVAITRAAAASAAKAEQVFVAGFRLKVLVNLALAVVLWTLAGPLATLLGQPAAGPFLRLVGLGVLASSIYTFSLTRLQAEQQFVRFAALRAAASLLKLGALWIVWRLAGLTVTSAIWTTIATLVLSAALGVLLDRGPLQWRLRAPGAATSLVRFGGFVVLSRVLFALYGRLDVFFLSAYRSLSEVATYNVATNLAYAIDLAAYSLVVARLPDAASLSGVRALRQHARTTMGLAAACVLALIPIVLLADRLMDVLFLGRYAESVVIFRILFVGSCLTLLVHPLYVVLYARERPGGLVLADLSLVVVTVIAAPLLVPAFGSVGAAIVSVSARAIGCAVIGMLVVRELSVPEPVPALSR